MEKNILEPILCFMRLSMICLFKAIGGNDFADLTDFPLSRPILIVLLSLWKIAGREDWKIGSRKDTLSKRRKKIQNHVLSNKSLCKKCVKYEFQNTKKYLIAWKPKHAGGPFSLKPEVKRSQISHMTKFYAWSSFFCIFCIFIYLENSSIGDHVPCLLGLSVWSH